ncbi:MULTISPECIES: single-stranded DNA-binding protein [unclassified Arthrobacter]|uniref:single-stranded DNA-binding protein n=1 Tax=unclassified Arthrobacter TaxID=235627 RepID=UPI001D15C6D0|nr:MULTISPECIES: single-stranded DNA-binding protein [unclassified Arthrobacter]MCC3275028.1 single-stranded DNA-binding protein [Arthrobacter sp. zg-Y20]MCC3279000.1 single-stranded DNA-binding protein [Arthrobacter sp. zg-Y40]MCC9177375.1 single-stranded DNA-binding protein [Arthrobacter sp. zg-Y750]MDK1315185.1 single-stranded DNA-binding protein [Arthrobacter sp. zg.Y20]MDK1328046.1 single-stranded DNA-binding protein [Arthrobacter sp. zg-Y1143]
MSDTITLRGYVATELRQNTTDNGLAVASFRMCTTERRYDRDAGSWLDGQTNWYAVSLFRQLATNAAFSIHKGDRVVVTGRLRLRQWATEDGRSGTSADIDADTVGHDLMWGTASFRRTVSGTSDRADAGSRPDGYPVGSPDAAANPFGQDTDLTDSFGRLADPLTGELPDADQDADSLQPGGRDESPGRGDADADADQPERDRAAAPF